jgi:hypothetical protein
MHFSCRYQQQVQLLICSEQQHRKSQLQYSNNAEESSANGVRKQTADKPAYNAKLARHALPTAATLHCCCCSSIQKQALRYAVKALATLHAATTQLTGSVWRHVTPSTARDPSPTSVFQRWCASIAAQAVYCYWYQLRSVLLLQLLLMLWLLRLLLVVSLPARAVSAVHE